MSLDAIQWLQQTGLLMDHVDRAAGIIGDKIASSQPSLRDYFAAHAPETPWPHFRPKVPPPPRKPMEDPIGNDGEAPTPDEERDLRGWYNDPVYDAEERHPTFSYWVKSWRDYWRACHDHEENVQIARRVQWPWFYADTMLAQRTKS